MLLSPPTGKQNNYPEFLLGGGEMGQRIREYDWSLTSLGPVEGWPQSLRTCIRIMLTSRQPIWIGWGKGLVKFYNDPYKAIVGGKHPWALGSPASVVWKDIWKDIEPMLKQVMENDEGTYVESQLLIMERNGYPEETYYTFSYTPIPGDDGKTAGMFCANTDDTDRIISERQLRTLTRLGKTLTDCQTYAEVIERSISTLTENPFDFPVALFRTIQADQAILSRSTPLGESSDLVKQIVEINADNPISDIIRRAMHTRGLQLMEDVPELVGQLPKGAWAIPPQKAIVLPIAISPGKESYGVLIVGLNPYRLLDEKYTSFFTLVGDQIATSLADVHVLEEERKRAEALAEIDRAKTTFFSNISHEFRTPLTLLLGPVEDALRDPDTRPTNRARMEVAYRNALRMQRLVNTLLEFSRIEAGRVEGRFSRVDICTLTKDLASTFRSAIEKAGMHLHFHCSEITEEVYVDIDMWEKIVLNLVSNAFKYSKEGDISLTIKQADQSIQFSVSDTGVGIPEEELDKIFDRFHRIENTHGRSQEGTGIGLAMVKELVRMHQGQIAVESQPGKGSTFTVTLPTGSRHLSPEKIINANYPTDTKYADAFALEALKWLPQQNDASQVIHDISVEDSLKQTSSHDKPLIVLADDNADMREYLQRLLSTQFEVVTAVDGEDALEKIASRRPELVISDIMMPRLDGFGLVKKIRSHFEMRNIPVLFLSARAGEEAKVEGLDAGADDYLTKPFSAKELIVRVSNHIRTNRVRRETEQQFYQVFMQAPAMINVFKGAEYRYELYHPLNKKLFGERDFTGLGIREAIPELEGQGIFEMLDEVYHTGKTVSQHERLVRLKNENGQLEDHYFNFVFQPWYDLKGAIQGIINFGIDITEIVKARMKVEESEFYFRRLADTVPDVIWITEKDGSCSYLNRRWFEITGQQNDEALGFGWLLATHPQDEEAAGRAFQEANEKQVLFSAYYRLRQSDNSYRWVLDRGQPRYDAHGEFEGYIGTVTDVHEQKLAEDELKQNEQQLNELANAMPQLVWVANADGEVFYYNDRVSEFAGAYKDATGHWKWEGLVHPDDLKATEEAWRKAVKNGSVYQVEHRIQKKDGQYRWFLSRGLPHKNKEGDIIKWFGTATDIHTSREQAAVLEEEVQKRTRQLNELNESLQQSNSELQQFAHVASHDLKEPLRKIKTFSSRLMEDRESSFSPNGRLYLKKVNSAADRMNSMIEGVLNYSMLSVAHQKIEKVDLNEVIKNIESDLEILITQKSATIRSNGLPTIEGASVLLYQLFYNLLNNSLKFSMPGSDALIEISHSFINLENKSFVAVKVADNGIGFEQEFAEKIFETFLRLNSKDKYEGTGLGLSLCKRIAERHGGHIEAFGEPGKGARFVVYLPVRQDKGTLYSR